MKGGLRDIEERETAEGDTSVYVYNIRWGVREVESKVESDKMRE